MNTNFISIVAKAYFLAMILISCESHEQKVDDAFNHIKEEKMLKNDSNVISKALFQEKIKTKPVIKNDQDEWVKFKIETEDKILKNEAKIKEIKSIPDMGMGLNRKVAHLEKDNNDLRMEMDEFKEETKVRWENFKLKMDHDANEIGIELKDISINNKK